MNDKEYWFNLIEESDSAVTVEFPSLSGDDDELMLNVLRCHLTY